MSLSCSPALTDRGYPPDMLKASPVRGFFPAPPHFFFPRTHALLDPLKSLGRLVSDTRTSLPVSMGNPFFLRGGPHAPALHGHPGVVAGHAWSSAVVTERADFSRGSASSPSSNSVTPPVERTIRVEPLPGRETFDFSVEDLFTALYGNCGGETHGVSHAISGVALPGNAGSDSHISTVDKETLQLPQGLVILHATFRCVSHCGVFADKTCIPKGTRFGPFQGKLVNTSEMKAHDDNTFMWEVFENGRLSHFVDGRGAAGGWMSLVKCARFPEEQNLVALQVHGQIFYEACKEIHPGHELLVWYGDCYAQFLGIPLTLKDTTEEKNESPPTEDAGEGYKCDRCGKVFAYRYYRDKHLKYTRCVDQGDRKFPCHLCSRSFEKRDRLRIHVLHVHEKHRPHKCTVCGKSFSQSSSLNKHMRVHSGERPYKCVYCNKAFTASSILRTHIRQHSGERPFKCKHCGKAFASHAAHDSHVRRTHTRDQAHPCGLCGVSFPEEQELRLHLKTHQKTSDNSLVLPSPGLGVHEDSGSLKNSPEVHQNKEKSFPYIEMTTLNSEYRPWN